MSLSRLGVVVILSLFFASSSTAANAKQREFARFLSNVTGFKTQLYHDPTRFDRSMTKMGYGMQEGYAPGWIAAMYQTTDNGPVLHIGPRIYRGLKKVYLKKRPKSKAELEEMSDAIWILGREQAHAIFNDVMHGLPGHDDHRADMIAMQNYVTLAKSLGMSEKKAQRFRKAFYDKHGF